jgi:hypothetical protein
LQWVKDSKCAEKLLKLKQFRAEKVSGSISGLNRYKRVVNIVNVVNVAERAMSYSTSNPVDHVPQRLWVFWDD